VAGELYVNQAKVSLVLPVTTTEGKKQFLYLLGNTYKKQVLSPILGTPKKQFLNLLGNT
jgi:hypothetical protein